MFGIKNRKRNRISKLPFPEKWINILENNVAYYNHLSEEDKAELRKHILIFLDEKKYIGCNDLEITDEMRVTIAAQACILLLHRKTDYYPTLKTILVYPYAFSSNVKKVLPSGVVKEGNQVRIGESWFKGPVVLSWDNVHKSSHDHYDGHNVVFHEFAHQLDSESGANEGTPLLPKRSMYLAWARVLGGEYIHLIEEIKHHHKVDIDPYGATNPAEFFAVVTEAFFEKPIQLKKHHAKLYEQLSNFYNQDPIKRFE